LAERRQRLLSGLDAAKANRAPHLCSGCFYRNVCPSHGRDTAAKDGFRQRHGRGAG